ncbi:MAG: hypothetical protein ACXAE3_10075 [Candidatus Kariarchaeaceae archaeon]
MGVPRPLQFATSGIRGKANTDISPELGLRVGRAVSAWLKKHHDGDILVYVGFDNRRNSHTIANTLIAGLSSSGIHAKMFDTPVPTPLVIYTTAQTDALAGVMVTGSHLPRDENGIILFKGDGSYFKGILDDSVEIPVEWNKLGKIESAKLEIEEYKRYLEGIKSSLKLTNFSWDVIVDPVHGPMKGYLEQLLKPLLRSMIKLNWEDDDTFSGRLSEPTPQNLEKALKAVEVSNSDLGIATDMDGDRVIFITSKPQVISGDYIGALLAKKFMTEYPELPVIVPINTSAIINYIAEEVGGKFVYCNVGPPSIIEAMQQYKAKYGFEETGKYFFTDHTIWPDASVSTLILLSFLQERGSTLEEEIDKMPVLYSLKTKVPSKRENGKSIMNTIRTKLDQYFDEYTLNDMDGFRIDFPDKSWLLIRPSGTEDYVRVFSEHNEKDKNDTLNEIGSKIVKDVLSESFE